MRSGAMPPVGHPIPRRWFRRYELLLVLLPVLLLFMWPKLWQNLTASEYLPHGHCYFWIPELVSLHLVSDLLIGASYVTISARLTYLVYRARRDIPFRSAFLAFGLFIIACGMTHLMEVWTLWRATYWLSGYVKLVTAVASVATAVVLPSLVPSMLGMVRAARLSEERKAHLERVNRELEDLRVRERQLADEKIGRLAAIVESSGDAIIGLTLDGIITSWNVGAERLYGYAAAETIGRNLSLIVPPGRHAELEGLLERAGREGAVESLETLRVGKDGRLIDIAVTASPVRDAAGAVVGVSTIARDMTERKRAERERAELLEREHAARQRAEEASRLKDEFLATVSHELRTPLTAILGWAHVLEDPSTDEETTRRGLSVITRSAEQQRQIIEDILDMSSIVRGKFRLRTQRVELASVAREVIDAAAPAALSKGLRVETAVEPGVVVSGDPHRLQQILWNLLSNAVKFTPAGGEVRVSVGRVGAQARLTVSDTGSGISPDFLPYVFERFRQADSSNTRQHGGLGLGLSIVRHLVELHGGAVQAASAGPGRGATFIVDLPVVDEAPVEGEEPERVDPPAAAPGRRTPRLAGVRVLLVDDDRLTLEMVSVFLRRAGAEVISAASAAAALDVLGRARPDVIVSDIRMAEADGYMLIGRVRALGAEHGGRTPAVALTAHAGAGDEERAIEAGFQAHLPKPVEPGELLALIARLTGREDSPPEPAGETSAGSVR